MLKKLLAGLLLVPALLVGAVIVNFYVIHPRTRAAPALEAPSDEEAIERGRYLAHHILGSVACHSPIDEERPGDFIQQGQLLAGRAFPVMPDMFPGRLVAPNLTPDTATGLGAWSDGEIARAIREGVSRDGRPLFPMKIPERCLSWSA